MAQKERKSNTTQRNVRSGCSEWTDSQGDWVQKKKGETGYGSRVTMSDHMINTKRIYEKLIGVGNSTYLCQTQLITWGTQHRFDDEVKDAVHGDFTPEMMKLPSSIWIETFSKVLPTKELDNQSSRLVKFTYKVSGVMCSVSICTHCWCVEGWMQS